MRLAQRKEKFCRKPEVKVLIPEAGVYEDLLPYKLAIRQKEERAAQEAFRQYQEARERVDRIIEKHEREMLREFCACAIILIAITAVITATVMQVM